MKMSNLLKEYSSKLRIKEHDELHDCSQKTPDWEKEVIMQLACMWNSLIFVDVCGLLEHKHTSMVLISYH